MWTTTSSTREPASHRGKSDRLHSTANRWEQGNSPDWLLSLQSQTASAVHSLWQRASAAIAERSHKAGATAQSCSSASTSSTSPSYLSCPSLLSSPPALTWPFIPGIASKKPWITASETRFRYCLSLPQHGLSYLLFLHFLFFSPLSFFSSKEVNSKTRSSFNRLLACYSTAHPAHLLNLFLYVVSAYSSWSVSHSGQTDM